MSGKDTYGKADKRPEKPAQINRNESLADLAEEGILILKDFTLFDADKGAARILGYRPDEFIGMDCRDLFTKDSQKKILKNLREGSPRYLKVDMIGSNGEVIHVVTNNKSLCLDNTDLNVIIIHRIEDASRAIMALDKSESELQLLAQHTKDVIWTLTKNLEFQYISPSVEKMHGYSAKELIGKKLDLLISPESLRMVLNGIKKNFQEKRKARQILPPTKVEIVGIHKNGRSFWTEVVVTPIINDSGELKNFVGVTRDISDRKRAELALKESEKRFRQMFEQSAMGMAQISAEGIFINTNHKLREILGYTSTALRKMNFPDIVDPEYLDEHRNQVRDFLRRRTSHHVYDIKLKRQNGESIWSRITTSYHKTEDDNAYFIAVIEDITEKKEIEASLIQALNIFENNQSGIYIYHLEDPEDDRSLRMVGANPASHKLTGVPVKEVIGKTLDENFPGLREKGIPQKYAEVIKTGIPITMEDLNYQDNRVIASGFSVNAFPLPNNHIGVSFENITKRKIAEAELKIRNAELNNFVYKVSHDLRAPLSSIRGLIHLAKLEKGEDEYLRRIGNSVEKLDEFIRNVLSHSRNLNTQTTIEYIDFKQMIKQCLKELDYLEGSKRIRKEIKVNARKFYGDPVRMLEIFRNAISNAIKYQDFDKKDPFVSIKINVTAKYADIEISDNGIGIEKAHINKIFDMFYRASEQSEGSGIGLYILDQAVKKLNGTLAIKSRHLKGTTLSLTIPNSPNQP